MEWSAVESQSSGLSPTYEDHTTMLQTDMVGVIQQ